MKKLLIIAFGTLMCGMAFAGVGPFKASEYANKADDILQRNAAGEITSTTSTDTLGSSSDRWDKIWADDIDTTIATIGGLSSGAVTIDVDDTEAFLVRKDGDAGDIFTVDTVGSNVTINGNTLTFGNGATLVNTSADLLTLTEKDFSFVGDVDITGGELQATTGTLNVSKSGSMSTFLGTLNVDEAVTFDSTLAVDDLDSLTATALLLGKATATSIEIADTGIETNIQGTLDVDENATFDGEVGIGQAPVSGSRLNLPLENDAVTPTLSFGDGDTGFYESADDNFNVSVGGDRYWQFLATNVLRAVSSTGAYFKGSGVSNINPTITPSGADIDTGIGSNAADQLSLISGGVEMLRLVEDTVSYVQMASNDMWLTWTDNAGTGTINAMKVNASDEVEFGTAINIGTLDLSDDSGLVGLVDMGVTATPSAGVVEGYSFAVDATDILTVYAEADGSGGIQNNQVIVGQTLGSATNPSLAFGDGDTGFYENSDDSLIVSIGGGTNWIFAPNYMRSWISGGAKLMNELASATNPVLIAGTGDDDTGIGSAGADQLSLIAGATELMRLTEDTANSVSINAATTLDIGTGYGQLTLDGSTGGCLMIRDTDDDGWTECSTLDGTMTCTLDADGVCDGS